MLQANHDAEAVTTQDASTSELAATGTFSDLGVADDLAEAMSRRGIDAHIEGFDAGKTCIECLRGVAHSLPALYEEDPSAVVGARGPMIQEQT